MKFLADMGISPATAQALRARGHDATHLADLGLSGAFAALALLPPSAAVGKTDASQRQTSRRWPIVTIRTTSALSSAS